VTVVSLLGLEDQILTETASRLPEVLECLGLGVVVELAVDLQLCRTTRKAPRFYAEGS
jgi:hypothetical protein